MEIRFVLEDDNKENLVDPSGEVLLRDEKNTIREPLAYLDAWLDGLITGLKEVASGRSAVVDVEEPHRVFFHLEDGGVRIEYKDAAVHAGSVEELRAALRKGADEFLTHLDRIGDTSTSEFYNSLRAFALG